MSKKPETAVPSRVAWAGVAGAAAAWVAILLLRPPTVPGTVLFLLACALPMWWLESHRFPQQPRKGDMRHALVPGARNWRLQLRLLGLMACLLFLLLTYSVFRQFATSYISGFVLLLPVIAPVCLGWALWMLFRAPRGRGLDSLESLGLALVHLRRRRFGASDRQAMLGWLVKAFYLPLMISSAQAFLEIAFTLGAGQHGWWKFYTMAYQTLFAVDTTFAAIGYCSTSRRIGAQIRSTEPTLIGWMVALVCYPPLNLLVLNRWLAYRDGYEWHHWLAGQPVLLFAWGAAILTSTALYVWATVAFGPRFSNLTNRGIITSGPYSLFKHPSYLGKNFAWWFISIPFISAAGPLAAATHCAALLAINGIYILRAKTEEQHLMRDPDYQAYSHWIANNGVLAKARRLLAGLQIGDAR